MEGRSPEGPARPQGPSPQQTTLPTFPYTQLLLLREDSPHTPEFLKLIFISPPPGALGGQGAKVANPQQDHCWKAQISGLSTCQQFLEEGHGGMHKGRLAVEGLPTCDLQLGSSCA